MAFSRTAVALLCVCIGVMLLVDVSAAQEQKAGNQGSTTQHFLRGNTIGAMTQGTPLTEDNTEESFDSFENMDLNDYPSQPAKPNGPPCRPRPNFPCKP